MFERELNREKNIEQILKKKLTVQVVDDRAEIKLEKLVKERIKKIEMVYLPFVNALMQKTELP